MATAEEILAMMEDEPEAQGNEVLVIDPETRLINVPLSEALFGVETDKDVERKYFRCPRIVGDNIDLSEHQIYIAYIAAKDKSGTSFFNDREAGLYYCDDMAVDGEDITFSWLLSGNVLSEPGFVGFKVLAKRSVGGELRTRWNTAPAVGTVLLTIPDGEGIIERYPDIINQLLTEMEAVKDIATPEAMQEYVNNYLNNNPVQPGATEEQLEGKINVPIDAEGNPQNGTAGQILETNGDGTTQWTDKPEGVEDGSITKDKLDDELRKELGLPASHKLTEVEIPVLQVTYSSLYDGTNSGSGTGCSTDLFLTPQYIRIENDTGNTVRAFKIRYADGDDVTKSNMINEWDTNGDNHGHGINIGGNTGAIAGTEEMFQTYEWGSTKRKYMQIAFQCDVWNNSWNKTRVYAIYDSYVPEYGALSDNDTDEYLQDFERHYFIGSGGNNANNKIMCAVPYYPNTRYYLRGGYYATVLINAVEVYGLYDDTALNNYCVTLALQGNAVNGDYLDSAETSYAPIFIFANRKTTQFDTSVNGGADNAYKWAYFDTPDEDELRGVKWLAFEMAIGDGTPSVSTEEKRKAVLDEYLSKGNVLEYVTRWDDKDLPRMPKTRLAKANPDAKDMGTRYMAFMSNYSRNPLVNAKWVLFGDSLTDNYGGHDATSDYFASKIAQEFNIDFDNRAKSGSNIYAGGSGNYTQVSGIIMLDAFLSEIDDGITEIPDYITVAFGTNSFKAQLGTSSDESDVNTSVYGATKYFIERLREKMPKARLAFVLPPKQNWGSNDPGNVRDIEGAREAIRTVCEKYCVKYKDLSTVMDLTNPLYSTDGIHPTTEAGQIIHYHEMRELMMNL